MPNVRETKAGDVMRKGVETISSKATVAEALRKMKQLKVSSLIVERRNKNDAFGILTDRKSTRLNSSHIQKSRMPSSA